jgi:hypothetical protein
MYQTLTTDEAAQLLKQDTNAAWTYQGARALVEYLEQVEEEGGERIEIDPVALRCEFSEYSSAREAAEDHGWDGTTDDADEDAEEQAALDWLRDRTLALVFDGRDASGVIVQSF